MKLKKYFFEAITKFDKITPNCKYFGDCGGCFMQNVSYENQLTIKEAYLSEVFAKIRERKDFIDKIQPSPDIFFYRNKMEFAFGNILDRNIIGLRRSGGFDRRDEQAIVSLLQCLIGSPLIEKIFPIAIKFINNNGFKIFNRMIHDGFLRHLVLRESKKKNQIMLILVTTSGKMDGLDDFVEELTINVPEIKSLCHATNDSVADVVKFEKLKLLYGSEYIEEKIHNLSFRIYPDTFFQVNIRATEDLYSSILSILQSYSDVKNILGLYSGVGAIEIFLSKYFDKVIGIDENHKNIKAANENLLLNKVENCTFINCRVEDLLNQINDKEFNTVIVDPPRAGLSKKAVSTILSFNPKRIIYVSCNPITFAENAKTLQSNGYFLSNVKPFDFFPHTKHIELLGLFLR